MTTKTTKTARKSAAKTKTSPILGEVDSKAKTPAKTTKGKTAAAKIPVAVRPGGEKWAAAKELLMGSRRRDQGRFVRRAPVEEHGREAAFREDPACRHIGNGGGRRYLCRMV